jgi:hypothetical protein
MLYLFTLLYLYELRVMRYFIFIYTSRIPIRLVHSLLDTFFIVELFSLSFV